VPVHVGSTGAAGARPDTDQRRIRVPEVRLIGEDGNQIGVMKTPDALAYAQERDLDLVEVARGPPAVCRVLDYSKYKYEQAQKLKAARKHQQQITIREIKFRRRSRRTTTTPEGSRRALPQGKDKVKVTIMFRGREVITRARRRAARQARRRTRGVAVIEQSPLQTAAT